MRQKQDSNEIFVFQFLYYVELDKRSKFEKQNENIAVTVLGYSWRISKENIRTHVINLLLIADKKKK